MAELLWSSQCFREKKERCSLGIVLPKQLLRVEALSLCCWMLLAQQSPVASTHGAKAEIRKISSFTRMLLRSLSTRNKFCPRPQKTCSGTTSLYFKKGQILILAAWQLSQNMCRSFLSPACITPVICTMGHAPICTWIPACLGVCKWCRGIWSRLE